MTVRRPNDDSKHGIHQGTGVEIPAYLAKSPIFCFPHMFHSFTGLTHLEEPLPSSGNLSPVRQPPRSLHHAFPKSKLVGPDGDQVRPRAEVETNREARCCQFRSVIPCMHLIRADVTCLERADAGFEHLDIYSELAQVIPPHGCLITSLFLPLANSDKETPTGR